MASRIYLLVALMLLADLAGSATISVQRDGTGDYMTLQPALDAVAAGDTVVIGPGEYTEWTMERLAGYNWDVKTFGRVKCQNLTLIGSGADETIIGPTTYEGTTSTFSPKCIAYDLRSGDLYVRDLTVRNCYEGVSLGGTLHMDRCRVVDCRQGVFWGDVGSGGSIRNSRIEVFAPILGPISFDIGAGGGGGNLVLEDTYWATGAVIRGVQGAVIRNCDIGGIGLYSGTAAYIYNCRTVAANSGVLQVLGSGAYCEIHDSELKGQYAALTIDETAPGSRFVVDNTRLEGGAHGVLFSGNGAGACTIHNCDLVKGTGPIVECAVATVPVTHDLTDNYWGTTSEADIQNWIVDHADNSSIGATVLYSPFAGQSVPTESTSWGDLKALFR